MGTAQPARIIDKLVKDTREIYLHARTETGFHFELVNLIRVDEVYRMLKSQIPSAQVHNVFGRIFCLKGDEYQARHHHQLAINMEPDNPIHYIDYGVTLEVFGRFDESASFYMAALKLSPRNLMALDYTIKTLRILKRYDEAVFYLDELIKLKPDDSELLMQKEILMDNIFPEERFRKSFIEKVEATAKEVESGAAPTFDSIEEMETYLASLPND